MDLLQKVVFQNNQYFRQVIALQAVQKQFCVVAWRDFLQLIQKLNSEQVYFQSKN
jgi:hypothetical protein